MNRHSSGTDENGAGGGSAKTTQSTLERINQFATLQSGRRLKCEKFQRMTIHGRESAYALALYVFHSRHFSQPQPRYEERFLLAVEDTELVRIGHIEYDLIVCA